MNRLKANKEIIKILSKMVNSNPDLRFTQLLINADIIWNRWDSEGRPMPENEYYLESEALLERIKRSILMEIK